MHGWRGKQPGNPAGDGPVPGPDHGCPVSGEAMTVVTAAIPAAHKYGLLPYVPGVTPCRDWK